MTREKFIPSFLLVSALALPLVACGGSDDDDDTEPTATAQPTPTATATATPTATATAVPEFDKWQKMTSFQIADEGDGLDYDGKGSAHDNGMYAAFETIQESLVTAVTTAVGLVTDFDGQDDACETDEDLPCAFTEEEADDFIGLVDTFVSRALTVESVNKTLAAPYDRGGSPQGINVVGEGGGHTIYYWSGANASGSWAAEERIGAQSGAIVAGGTSTFGPGDFEFVFEVGGGVGPNAEPPTEYVFKINDAKTAFTWNEDGVNGALTGGGIEIVALTTLVEGLLDTLEENDLLPAGIDKDEVLGQVQTALTEASDITCPSLNNAPCFSVSFEYDAEKTSVSQ